MSAGKPPVAHPLPYLHSAEYWFETIRGLPMPVLLASGSSEHRAARFDIVTADPEIVLRTRANQTQVCPARGAAWQDEAGAPFAVLARHCPLQPRLSAEHPASHLPFTGGAIGYFGYELQHGLNGIDWSDKRHIALPDMLVGIYQWAIIVDHQQHQSWLVLRDTDDDYARQLHARLDMGPQTSAGTFTLRSPFASNYTLDAYLQRFNRINDYIHAGDCYQVNLAQCFSATCEGDSWTAFRRLQQRANAPFAAYLEDGAQAVLSFSPERFLRVTNLDVMTQPIKGTRPRSADPEQDQANRIDLETSTKDRAENLMIVDLLRNDLGRVCAFGSVSVENLFETQSFTNVHHLVSTVKGRLGQASDVFQLLAASFPGGSITGTPKRRAMEIINELEDMPRSVYCGAIAWIDRSGDMDSNICIRTLVKDGSRIHCWGGGGIVADSDGPSEYQETLDKISILIDNL